MTKNEQSRKQDSIDSDLEHPKTSKKDSPKSHGEILKQQIVDGQVTFDRNPSSILLSSLTAGMEIGFTYLSICTLHGSLFGRVDEMTIFKLMALVYPVGFIMVVMGQSILFTEQTSLLTLPVLHNKRSIRSLLKLWGLVIVGNLAGGCIMAVVLIWIGPKLEVVEPHSIEAIAVHITKYDNWVIFVSAILAGWLMGLLSWLVTASKDTVSRIIIIYMITAVLAFAGLHHSIVGNVEVFAGLLISTEITLLSYISFESISLIGNALGGAVFVALLKYRAFVYNVEN
ncbi:formate/nitrite transporter family protein [Desulfogranum japonicum]|uniref:formate/nitrite transporter family protein n=1 Tax=Desulfogranum japonicum TaxID=231447 RepID=UPI0003F7256C|nr:formate/nitrite transporter family protein [Desulfogranum japonicum]